MLTLVITEIEKRNDLSRRSQANKNKQSRADAKQMKNSQTEQSEQTHEIKTHSEKSKKGTI